jgi:hypothetical protein
MFRSRIVISTPLPAVASASTKLWHFHMLVSTFVEIGVLEFLPGAYLPAGRNGGQVPLRL